MSRPRDPDCTCEIEFPGARRIWCDRCKTDGPLPGSLADPEADDSLDLLGRALGYGEGGQL